MLLRVIKQRHLTKVFNRSTIRHISVQPQTISSAESTDLKKDWSDIPLNEKIKNLLYQNNISSPSLIQEKAIPLILENKDIIGRARTGTGKTLAFLLPLIHQQLALKNNSRNPKVLILSPTRELAQQINEEFKKYANGLRSLCLYGGAPYQSQIRQLREGIDFAIGTPGRVLDLIQKEELKNDCIKHFVLDEADHMMDIGFEKELNAILETIPKDNRQTLLFSATLPDWLHKMSREYLKDPHTLDLIGSEFSSSEFLHFYALMAHEKNQLNRIAEFLQKEHTESTLKQMAQQLDPSKLKAHQTLIFMNSKKEIQDSTSELMEKLPSLKISSLHGDLSQQARNATLEAFRQQKLQVLCCTDVAARGLDIPGVDLVIQMNPFDRLKGMTKQIPSSQLHPFLHRAGRSGRAGQTGKVLVVLPPEQSSLLPLLNKHLVHPVEIVVFNAHKQQQLVDDLILQRLKQTEALDVKYTDLVKKALEQVQHQPQVLIHQLFQLFMTQFQSSNLNEVNQSKSLITGQPNFTNLLITQKQQQLNPQSLFYMIQNEFQKQKSKDFDNGELLRSLKYRPLIGKHGLILDFPIKYMNHVQSILKQKKDWQLEEINEKVPYFGTVDNGYSDRSFRGSREYDFDCRRGAYQNKRNNYDWNSDSNARYNRNDNRNSYNRNNNRKKYENYERKSIDKWNTNRNESKFRR